MLARRWNLTECIRNTCRDMGMTLHGRLVLCVDHTAVDIELLTTLEFLSEHYYGRAIHYLRDLTLRRILPLFVTTHREHALTAHHWKVYASFWSQQMAPVKKEPSTLPFYLCNLLVASFKPP